MITEKLTNINMVIASAFFLLYVYQIFFILVPFIKKDEPHKKTKLHRFAVMISARNEENVIAQLIRSLKEQDYPQDMMDVFVVADNCTDATASIARDAGAIVYERFNTEQVGKGYALDFLIGKIFKRYGKDYYDAFMVFDADNILEKNYVTEMNKTFSDGHRIITSYRNSKNYGTNWISAGYALWFLRESKYLNNARMLMNTSCAISGTGFLVHKDIIKKNNGWKCFLLTEDIQFSIKSVIDGEKIAYCKDAVLYDEQPVTFSQAWTQRLRWARGFLEVFAHHGSKLISTMFKTGSFSCYDMTMTILPSIFLSFVTAAMNIAGSAIALYNGESISQLLVGVGYWILNVYLSIFVLGLITTITERKQIHCSTKKKILYMFTFPIYLFTYIPISIAAVFRQVKWEPIQHGNAVAPELLKETNVR